MKLGGGALCLQGFVLVASKIVVCSHKRLNARWADHRKNPSFKAREQHFVIPFFFQTCCLSWRLLNTMMDQEEEYVELPDNDYFYEGVVGVAMEIVADCKQVVEVVNVINAENESNEPNTEQMKETFTQAVKRIPTSSAKLVDLTQKFVKENEEFYVDDPDFVVRCRPFSAKHHPLQPTLFFHQ